MPRAAIFALAFIAASAAMPAHSQDLATERHAVRVETVARGLVHPWGLSFLPDGRAVVTERPGRLRLVSQDGRLSDPLAGVPQVFARNQGGLLDIAVAPDFASSRLLFFCYADEAEGGSGTALGRGRLVETGGAARLEDVRRIYRQNHTDSRGQHYGCRIAFRVDGTLFLTLGDQNNRRERAQDLGSAVGKIVRLNQDGSIPSDNPFRARSDALPEIWSYGHRNVQAAAIEPGSGRLWTAEHGARNGDEINRPEAGRNYGWPSVSYGTEYSGVRFPGNARDGIEQPIFYWNDETIAPSGAAFVSGTRFPNWRGDMLIGGLRSRIVMRLNIRDGRVVASEKMFGSLNERIRDVREAPDGSIWLVTDAEAGRILRVTPRSN
jgi:glucose/arabinose dehydrogenase